MPAIAFYHTVWGELNAAESELRAACKANLARLAVFQPGTPTGLRLEKVHDKIIELKVSWNRQEYRLLFFYGPNQTAYIVNFFQKRTRKTPPREINLALVRMREIQLEQSVVISRSLH
jgi:phage-related protein